MEMLQKFICSCSGKSPCSDDELCSCLAQGCKCWDVYSCSIKCQNIEIQTENVEDVNNDVEIETECETEHS